MGKRHIGGTHGPCLGCGKCRAGQRDLVDLPSPMRPGLMGASSKKIITCGSKSFTPAQQRYTTIELECLAIIWAIQKCEFFLKGLPTFTVATDHHPLVGTFAKNLADLTNPRLQRLREKVSAYCFEVQYVPGKTHNIADALSRAATT